MHKLTDITFLLKVEITSNLMQHSPVFFTSFKLRQQHCSEAQTAVFIGVRQSLGNCWHLSPLPQGHLDHLHLSTSWSVLISVISPHVLSQTLFWVTQSVEFCLFSAKAHLFQWKSPTGKMANTCVNWTALKFWERNCNDCIKSTTKHSGDILFKRRGEVYLFIGLFDPDDASDVMYKTSSCS